MRPPFVPPGASKVRFHFEPSLFGLKITLAAIATGLVLCGMLFIVHPREPGLQEVPAPPTVVPSRMAVGEKAGKVKTPKP